MKRYRIILSACLLCLLLSGCTSVSQEEYAALQTELNQANSRIAAFEEMEEKYATLSRSEMDAQQAANELQAENARREREKLLAQERATQEAEAAAAQAAEAAKLKEYVPLKELLSNPEKYDGKFIRVEEVLFATYNDLENQSLSTYLAVTRDGISIYDTTFGLDIFYNKMENASSWAQFSATYSTNPRIKVAGTFHLYGNRNRTGYIVATEMSEQ